MAEYIREIIILTFILLGVSMFLVGKFCKKRTLRITLFCLLTLLTIYSVIFSIDVFRVASQRKPIFAKEYSRTETIAKYKGLGYRVNCEKDSKTGVTYRSEMYFFGELVSAAVSSIRGEYPSINEDIIKKLLRTDKIVTKTNTGSTIVITNEQVISEILSIFSKSYGDLDGAFTCEGASTYLEMYDSKDKLIDTVDIWISGSIMPRSMTNGCAKYSLTKEDSKALNIIIEEQKGTKFFTIYDYTEVCADAIQVIYEDDKYSYYFGCIKSHNVYIEFLTTDVKVTVKEALDNGLITIDELLGQFPDLLGKWKK